MEQVKKSGFRGGDENINRRGRPKKGETKKATNRELKEQELMLLLRKIKPHVADAIMAAAKIMKNDQASHQNQLRAALILIDHYRKLSLDMYGDQALEDEEGTEVQPQQAAILSLKVVE